MFVQVIEGKVADAERLRQQLDRWNQELRSGAGGFIGTTGGVTDDGRGMFLARFDSAAEAKANSDRPEQGQWWAETASCFDGEVTFTDSEDTEASPRWGSDDAGFVQVMKSSGVDRDKVHEMDRQFEEVAAQWRPDLIGSTGSGQAQTAASTSPTSPVRRRPAKVSRSRRHPSSPTSRRTSR